jgi:hypothetical protein
MSLSSPISTGFAVVFRGARFLSLFFLLLYFVSSVFSYGSLWGCSEEMKDDGVKEESGASHCLLLLLKKFLWYFLVRICCVEFCGMNEELVFSDSCVVILCVGKLPIHSVRIRSLNCE